MRTILAAALAALVASPALADSCWNHNGSIMRLVAQGSERYFYYEHPRQGMQNAGVRRGTLLFNGRKNGNWYSGIARVFNPRCGAPLEYYVEGPVHPNQTQVTMQGTRDTYTNCQYNGGVAADTLVFTYAYQC